MKILYILSYFKDVPYSGPCFVAYSHKFNCTFWCFCISNMKWCISIYFTRGVFEVPLCKGISHLKNFFYHHLSNKTTLQIHTHSHTHIHSNKHMWKNINIHESCALLAAWWFISFQMCLVTIFPPSFEYKIIFCIERLNEYAFH